MMRAMEVADIEAAANTIESLLTSGIGYIKAVRDKETGSYTVTWEAPDE